MVQAVTSNEITLVWTTNWRGKPTACVLVPEGKRGEFAKRDFVTNGRRYVAKFKELEPGQSYEYSIAGGKSATASSRVRTAPPPGTPFLLAAFGDSGEGNDAQRRIGAGIVAAKPDLVVHTGDLIYENGAREDYPAKFFQPYAALLATTPFYPCLGNHDLDTEKGQPMFDEFELPTNGPPGETPERHYWFDYGGARFVALDSNLGFEQLESTVAPWLDQVLAEAGDRWKIVFFHHPVYTLGKYEPTHRIRYTLVPVFERRGVQLVLCGHDHLYERYKPIRQDKVVGATEGVVYVTTGAGGGELYEAEEEHSDQLAARYRAKHSFTLVEFGADDAKLRQVDIDGKVVDESVIVRHRTMPGK